MANSLFTGLGQVTQLSDLFKHSSEKISQNINVATLAKIISITREYDPDSEDRIKYGVAQIEPIPAISADSRQIEAYFFSNNFSVGNIVAVIFMDQDFRNIISQPQGINRQIENKVFHTKMTGVLIKL